jgi:hypothetical protein
MHPDMASALASQHRHEMTARASHHAQATWASETAGPRPAVSPRGPRRGARRAHLSGARRAHLSGRLLPRYRVSWSRTALSASAPDGARRGRSWVIVISATRGL